LKARGRAQVFRFAEYHILIILYYDTRLS